jgi:tyrosyl-tRNA synthetase
MSKVEKVYNSTWLDKLTFAEIGRQANAFSVADFISRDNIKKRLDDGKRVSLREMLYPLMQGYDSVVVQADVEIGGTDQWFNLLAGRVLQEEYGQAPQHIMTNALIMGLDGRKMSSSWGNTIILSTSPNDMYGKVMSLNDELVESYFKVCTRVPQNEIEQIISGDPKEAKMRLAFEIVKLVYSESDATNAQNSFEQTFSKGNVPEDIQTVKANGKTLADILLESKLITSKKELRRLIDEGAVTNLTAESKIESIDAVIEETSEIKIGKKRFIKIEV